MVLTNLRMNQKWVVKIIMKINKIILINLEKALMTMLFNRKSYKLRDSILRN